MHALKKRRERTAALDLLVMPETRLEIEMELIASAARVERRVGAGLLVSNVRELDTMRDVGLRRVVLLEVDAHWRTSVSFESPSQASHHDVWMR